MNRQKNNKMLYKTFYTKKYFLCYSNQPSYSSVAPFFNKISSGIDVIFFRQKCENKNTKNNWIVVGIVTEYFGNFIFCGKIKKYTK